MIVSGGRNGSLFFQSLLDSHPQILQMPGIFYIDKLLPIFRSAAKKSLSNEFIENFPQFFSSETNKLHRMNQLGEDCAKSITVDTNKFLLAYDRFSQEVSDNFEQALLALHIAYAEAAGDQEISQKRLLVIHIHHAPRLEKIKDVLSDFSVVFIERDPLPSLISEMNGRLDYFKCDVTGCLYARVLHRKLFEPSRILKITNKVWTVRLEDIHLRHRDTIGAFCSRFGIDYHLSLENSTFGGLKWWGDEISKRPMNGVNANFANSDDISDLFLWEVNVIEGALKDRVIEYGYSFRGKACCNNRLLLAFPGKYDFKILFRLIRCLLFGSWYQKLRSIKSLLTFYRVLGVKRKIICSFPVPNKLPPLLSGQ